MYIDTDTLVSPAVFEILAESAPISFLQPRHYFIPQSVVHQLSEDQWQKKHIDRLMILTSILSIMVFGGLHLFAWSLHFPRNIEKVLLESISINSCYCTNYQRSPRFAGERLATTDTSYVEMERPHFGTSIPIFSAFHHRRKLSVSLFPTSCSFCFDLGSGCSAYWLTLGEHGWHGFDALRIQGHDS